MDLLAKAGVIAIIIVIVAAAILILTKHTSTSQFTQAKAESVVLADLQSTHPNATIALINASPSSLERSSWSFVFTVVYNATKPCPTLFIEAFDYPATGLVPTVDNLYTSNCKIYNINSTNSAYRSYVISSPYVAIVESYDQGTGAAGNYVRTHGYDNTAVQASYYPTIAASATPLNITVSNGWIVSYTAAGAAYTEHVVISNSGSIVGNYTLPSNAPK